GGGQGFESPQLHPDVGGLQRPVVAGARFVVSAPSSPADTPAPSWSAGLRAPSLWAGHRAPSWPVGLSAAPTASAPRRSWDRSPAPSRSSRSRSTSSSVAATVLGSGARERRRSARAPPNDRARTVTSGWVDARASSP